MFWHGAFPLFVLAYFYLRSREKLANLLPVAVPAAIAASILAVASVCTVLTFMAVIGHDYLPRIVEGGAYSMLVTKGVSPAICLLTYLVLAVLWRRAARVLDLWLCVVMCVWLFDIALSAVVGARRYDLGWYGGRVFGLIGASLVLGALLLEMNHLYNQLSDALAMAEERNSALLKSREELAHAQRLEAVGQLTGGLAHDFNNLLTIVSGNLELIARKPDDAGKVERMARVALTAVSRGAHLTQQLLTFARRQTTAPETVNLNRLITEFERLLRQAVGENVEIRQDLNPFLDPVHLDPVQFEAALLNLAVNARDAMGGGGQIVIETRNIELNGGSPSDFDLPAGPYVAVTIRDTGNGMAPDVAARAYEPFFTTKEVGKGSGLGLERILIDRMESSDR